METLMQLITVADLTNRTDRLMLADAYEEQGNAEFAFFLRTHQRFDLCDIPVEELAKPENYDGYKSVMLSNRRYNCHDQATCRRWIKNNLAGEVNPNSGKTHMQMACEWLAALHRINDLESID